MIEQWLSFMLHRSLDFSLAFAVGYVIWKLREQRIPPQWACWLFAALLLKLMVPGFAAAPMPGVRHLTYAPAEVEQPAAPVNVAVVATPKSETYTQTPSVSSETILVTEGKPASGWNFPSWPQCAFAVWLAVVVVLALRELRAHWRLQRLIRDAKPF
ncbi:hypothetical protein K8I31_01785, partial [bacterium]|nr:hypothetical protein [bacterium]